MEPNPDPAPAPRTRSRRGLVAAITMATLIVLGVVGYVVAVLVAPTTNASGQCTGIGFGCVPSPQTSLILTGMFIGIPVLIAVLVLGSLGCVLLLRRTQWSGIAIGLVAVVASGVVSVVAAVVVLLLAL